MHQPISPETAPWAGPFTPPSGARSSPSSVLSSPPKQKLQPPVTKYRKKSKRGKTLSASFSLEETYMPFSSWVILWNSTPLVSSSESGEELAFIYQSLHSTAPSLNRTSAGQCPAKWLHSRAAVQTLGGGIRTLTHSWQVCLTLSSPGLIKENDLNHQGSSSSGNKRPELHVQFILRCISATRVHVCKHPCLRKRFWGWSFGLLLVVLLRLKWRLHTYGG